MEDRASLIASISEISNLVDFYVHTYQLSLIGAEARAQELKAEAEANYVRKVAKAQAETIAIVNKAINE